MILEVIGIVASLSVLASMLFKTNSYKGAFYIRLINAIGSVIFVVYGLLIPAYSTAFMNFFAAIINTYYLFRLKKDYNVS